MRALPLAMLVILAAPATASEPELLAEQPTHVGIEVSTGIEYEAGDYGTRRQVRRLSVPLTVRAGAGRLQVGAWLPYTRLDAPGNVVAGGFLGLPIIVDPTRPARRNRRQGIGDLTVGASYTVPTPVVALKASGEVKLPTAARGLGTGKADYAGAVEASRAIGNVSPFVSVGYTVPGDPQGVELRDSVSFTGGVAAKLGAATHGVVAYSRARNVNEELADEQQVTTGVNTALGDGLSLGMYGAVGLSDGSPDVGAGVRIGVRLR